MKTFKCDDCDYAPRSKSRLEAHKNAKHNKNPELYECDLCDDNLQFVTKWKHHIKAHKENVHMNLKPFRCDICKYSSYFRNNILKHTNRMHGNCVFKCDLCDNKYNHKSGLLHHHRAEHLQQPWNCQLCEYSTSRLNGRRLNGHFA